jgi:methyl-accepting chemotaxis protein
MKLKRSKLIVMLALAAVFAGAGFAVDRQIRGAELERFTQKFALLATLRKSALETYLTTVRGEITFWSVSETLRDVTGRLQEGWSELGEGGPAALQSLYLRSNPFPPGERAKLVDADDGSSYSFAHAAVHELAAEFVSNRGYYDFFLIDPQGNIIYSVEKEADYATNLRSGPYQETGLAEVFRRAMDDSEGNVHLSDFERYAPSDGAPAIFMARKMSNDAGEPLGVLAMQLPTAKIVDIMQFNEGMGVSGETYLVGEDLLMRSDSRFSDTSTILNTSVDTGTVQQALSGASGIEFTQDYRGIRVLSAYDSIDVDNFRWAVMAEIDEEEVRAGTSGLAPKIFGGVTALYGFALWTMAVFGRAAFPDQSGGGVLPDLDVGQG